MKLAASASPEDAAVLEFKNNPEEAAAYLSSVLEGGDQEEVPVALRRITSAFGGVSKRVEPTDAKAKAALR